jgi:hypothetical protein
VAESSSGAGSMPEIQRRVRLLVESIVSPGAWQILFELFCNECLKSALIVAELSAKVLLLAGGPLTERDFDCAAQGERTFIWKVSLIAGLGAFSTDSIWGSSRRRSSSSAPHFRFRRRWKKSW